jgi:hypothetical protein
MDAAMRRFIWFQTRAFIASSIMLTISQFCQAAIFVRRKANSGDFNPWTLVSDWCGRATLPCFQSPGEPAGMDVWRENLAGWNRFEPAAGQLFPGWLPVSCQRFGSAFA